MILNGHTFPVLPTEAYLLITGMFDLKGGATLSFLLLAPALLVFFLQRMLLGKKSFVSVTGKNGARTEFAKLPRCLSIFLSVVCSIVVVFILCLYKIILWGSFVKVWSVNNTFPLEHYVSSDFILG